MAGSLTMRARRASKGLPRDYCIPEFSFKPPPALFIDAALQAQDDSEHITTADRAKSEVHTAWLQPHSHREHDRACL